MQSSLTKRNRGGKRRPKAKGRIWIVPPSWKPPAPSPCEARAGRGLERGAPSIELARLIGIPSPLPSPHSSVVGRGNRPAAWWWCQDAIPSARLREGAIVHRITLFTNPRGSLIVLAKAGAD